MADRACAAWRAVGPPDLVEVNRIEGDEEGEGVTLEAVGGPLACG